MAIFAASRDKRRKVCWKHKRFTPEFRLPNFNVIVHGRKQIASTTNEQSFSKKESQNFYGISCISNLQDTGNEKHTRLAFIAF